VGGWGGEELWGWGGVWGWVMGGCLGLCCGFVVGWGLCRVGWWCGGMCFVLGTECCLWTLVAKQELVVRSGC